MARPTKYSKKMNEKAIEYLESCVERDDVPYTEELAAKLGIHRETIINWSNEHDEFFDTIKAIKNYQAFKLQKGSLTGDYNPTSAIFQLKANHGMIETERKMLVGKDGEALVFNWKNAQDDNN